MKHTNKEINENIRRFVELTDQPEVRHVVNYCIGYYGCITPQIWREITQLAEEGVVVW